MPAIVSNPFSLFQSNIFISILVIILIAVFVRQTRYIQYDLDFDASARRIEATLHRRSYFYVGGEYLSAQNSAISFGQMYVEHLVPSKVSQPFPIVFIPGNGR